jgi:hypothetical protein
VPGENFARDRLTKPFVDTISRFSGALTLRCFGAGFTGSPAAVLVDFALLTNQSRKDKDI